jgi:hypothetical protein
MYGLRTLLYLANERMETLKLLDRPTQIPA